VENTVRLVEGFFDYEARTTNDFTADQGISINSSLSDGDPNHTRTAFVDWSVGVHWQTTSISKDALFDMDLPMQPPSPGADVA
jgi:hypothetical protein